MVSKSPEDRKSEPGRLPSDDWKTFSVNLGVHGYFF